MDFGRSLSRAGAGRPRGQDDDLGSVQGQRVLDMAEASRAEAGALLDVYRVQFALDAAAPEFEKALQLRIIRRQIEFLPDEALQQRRIIRQMINDLRGGEPVSPGLQLVSVHVDLFRFATPLQQGCRVNCSAATARPGLFKQLAAWFRLCCQASRARASS